MNPAAGDLRVAGLERLSSCDWPGQLCATVFCQGCAWACPYCHNAALRPMHTAGQIAWSAVRGFLSARARLLDGVVFSGGEPTLQPALAEAMRETRAMGFRIGLHTAGPSAERIRPLLPLLDWVGFDVKAPFADYARVTGVAASGERAQQSLRLLLEAGVAVEVRTTVHPSLLASAELDQMRMELLAMGVRHYVLQRYRTAGVAEDKRAALPVLPMPQLAADYGAGFAQFAVR